MKLTRDPIVLLHGFTGCAAVWNDVIAALPKSCSCHPLDLPGHGERSALPSGDAYTFDGVCDLIAGDVTRMGLRRIALWGYSMGGRIALHFALRHPELLSFLILESCSPGLANRRDRELRLQVDEELSQRLEADGLERFIDFWMEQPLFASQKQLPIERQEEGRRLRLSNSATGLAAALRGFSVGRQLPLHNRLSELAMPTLVLAGELDSKYRELGESMAHSIPGARFRIIAEAGHAPHWERPAATAAVALELLDQAQTR